MYKIYINETQISLTNHNPQILLQKNKQDTLLGIYDGKVKTLFRYIDLAEKTNRYEKIVITYNDVEILKKDFKSLFKIVKAAGGVVFNEEGEILVIFRRGMWDLPKGKIDKGEEIIDAAIREVEEETGVVGLIASELFCKTLHTYKQSGSRILKKTYWYKMTAKKQQLKPQNEEGIELAQWMLPKDLLKEKLVFKNIRNVVKKLKSSS